MTTSQNARAAWPISAAVVALAALLLRRLAQDQYWGWRNRIWDKGWTDAWECAEQHMRAYEDTPETYLAEHGHWWRAEEAST